MGELRWALLGLGVPFLLGLALWEWRRQRPVTRAERELSTSQSEERAPLPEMNARSEAPAHHALPIVELDPGRLGEREPAEEQAPPPALITAPGRQEPVIGEFTLPDALAGAELTLPTLEPVPDLSGEGTELRIDIPPDAAYPEAASAEPSRSEPPAEPVASVGAPTSPPLVEWPPDEMRRVIALRLVAPGPERFSGRAVRQALAAEGFELGKFSIFHKADADRRAYLSAADLTQPGTFDLETMDAQRFSGLSLFAVLPGPKPASQALEELLLSARSLNDRLEGALQDERGGPLTPKRIALWRESVQAEEPNAL